MTKQIDPTRETVLILRTCKADMSSHSNFVWPESGYVEAPDWENTQECGNGLHGWLKGVGDPSLGYLESDGYRSLVVETYADHIVDLNGKVKFPAGWVVFCGELHKAAALIIKRHPDAPCIGGTATAGDGGTATVGYRGTATAGDGGTATVGYRGTTTAGDGGTATAGSGGTATAGYRGTATAGSGGTATAGDRGTATAGDRGTATAGYRGTATVGDGGTATAGYRGTATAGDRGTATVGDGGTATAGDGGTATVGYRGTATAGDRGTATVGDGGTATAGDRGTATAGSGGTATVGDGGTATAGSGGVIAIQRWNGKRWKYEVAEVSKEDGLKPNTPYRLDNNGSFVEAE